MIRVFVGYDPREAIAFHVCANSIIRQCSEPVSITPLALNTLAGYSEKHGDGSNDFIYSRFLVPHLCHFSGHAIYLDGDMVMQGDIAELWAMRSHRHDVQVVQHTPYKTKAAQKYFDAPNEDYPRKNWSSVILWNCASYPNRVLTPEYVAKHNGAHLHRFAWCDDARIGELDAQWNWMPQEFGPRDDAKLLHWTLGAPCFDEYADTEMAEVWQAEYKLTINP